MEHMKNTHRQKMTSTIGTTLIATGFSLESPPPAMVVLRARSRALLLVRCGFRRRDLDLVDPDRAAELDHLLDVPVRGAAVRADQDAQRGKELLRLRIGHRLHVELRLDLELVLDRVLGVVVAAGRAIPVVAVAADA